MPQVRANFRSDDLHVTNCEVARVALLLQHLQNLGSYTRHRRKMVQILNQTRARRSVAEIENRFGERLQLIFGNRHGGVLQRTPQTVGKVGGANVVNVQLAVLLAKRIVERVHHLLPLQVQRFLVLNFRRNYYFWRVGDLLYFDFAGYSLAKGRANVLGWGPMCKFHRHLRSAIEIYSVLRTTLNSQTDHAGCGEYK